LTYERESASKIRLTFDGPVLSNPTGSVWGLASPTALISGITISGMRGFVSS
jgi:hypothetical protein